MAKVILCHECKGEGTIARPIDESKDEKGYFRRNKCKECKGTGRLIEKTSCTPFTPLNNGFGDKDGDWSR